ncbi:unnamed protein product [Adineta steineri]|uniref:Uncharacterized protein n=2 Tax=Adineta steineri TaxID=433720 RepID=A0A814SLH7_9BILA|nr:unnamed protein product [Adineta steineri]
MKLLLVFAFLALICLARSAPSAISKPRQLILPHYDEDEEIKIHVDEDHTHGIDTEDADEDDEEEPSTTTTTTTTTTRRAPYAFPTRDRNLIPSRRPIRTQRPTTRQTTTTVAIDYEQNDNEYDGDYKYIRDFRKYIQQLVDDIKKVIRNLTGMDLSDTPRRQQYPEHED